MSLSPTHAYSNQLAAAIQHAIQAYTYFPNTPRDAIRLWDRQTPYVIHPIWCAMTLLTETSLSEDIRYPGAIALLWHDTLEDTQLPLPEDTSPIIRELVQEMTFASLDEGVTESSASGSMAPAIDREQEQPYEPPHRRAGLASLDGRDYERYARVA